MARLTEEAYSQLEGGMSLAEVEAILGGPPERERPAVFPTLLCSPDEYEERFWSDGETAMAVVFNRKTGRAEAWDMAYPPKVILPGTAIPGPTTEW